MRAAAPEPWDGESYVVAISPDRAVVSPAGAALIVNLLDRYRIRGDGIPFSPEARYMRAVLAPIAARGGHADIRTDPSGALLPDDEISTTDACELLGYSREHVGRLAREGLFGPTRKSAGRRLVSRAEVLAYRAANPTDPGVTSE